MLVLVKSPIYETNKCLEIIHISLDGVVWCGVVWFHGKSTFVGYLIPNPLYTYVKFIFSLLGFLWYINCCSLFNAKTFLYICTKYIWFGLVGFYGISTIVGCLMPNPLYTFVQLIGAVEYTDCISTEELDPPTLSVLIMTLNNLMVRFQ